MQAPCGVSLSGTFSSEGRLRSVWIICSRDAAPSVQWVVRWIAQPCHWVITLTIHQAPSQVSLDRVPLRAQTVPTLCTLVGPTFYALPLLFGYTNPLTTRMGYATARRLPDLDVW